MSRLDPAFEPQVHPYPGRHRRGSLPALGSVGCPGTVG
jgi:hypothetical protein